MSIHPQRKSVKMLEKKNSFGLVSHDSRKRISHSPHKTSPQFLRYYYEFPWESRAVSFPGMQTGPMDHSMQGDARCWMRHDTAEPTELKSATQFARDAPPELKSATQFAVLQETERGQGDEKGGALPALLLQDPLLPTRNLFFAFLSHWGSDHTATRLQTGTTPIQTWRHALLGGLPTEIQQALRPRVDITGGKTSPLDLRNKGGRRGGGPPLPEVEVLPRPGGPEALARSAGRAFAINLFWGLRVKNFGVTFCSPSIGLQSLKSSPWALQDLTREQRDFLPAEPMDVANIRKVVAIDAEWEQYIFRGVGNNSCIRGRVWSRS